MSALGTFFGWRGAHHGKRGAQAGRATTTAVTAQTEMLRRVERAKWDATRAGVVPPRELWTQAELVEAGVGARGSVREMFVNAPPLPVWAWWTLLVVAILSAVTVVGIPVTLVLAFLLVARNPYRAGSTAGVTR